MDQWIQIICTLCDTVGPQTVSQGTNKHSKLKPAHQNTVHETKWKIRIGIKKVHGSGCHMLTLHEAACTVSDIKCCVHVWVTDWWKGLV